MSSSTVPVPRELSRVLVANRGEIAVRVLRGIHDAGLLGVAVYADSDKTSPHVRVADASYPLVGSSAAETYLDSEKLLMAAAATGADAVHPGYGFLSENADFAAAVIAAGLVWIGPNPQTIRDLGDKVTARRIARQVGAPLVPGTEDPVSGPEEVAEFARKHGLPIAIKAAFGGGGRGMRVAHRLEDIPGLFEAATRESVSAFGRGECFVERYLDRSRHVEAQIIADQFGTIVVAGTRDCSLQRRHQKLVEEAPSPFLTVKQRETIVDSARRICAAAGYVSAGTVEYLLGQDGTVSFLEVNTRLQVEHPVTEETTGLDLVVEQLRVASGRRLSISEDPEPVGHSFEFRINGEDPGNGFLPAPGVVTRYVVPSGPGVRVDSGIEQGSVIGGQFDSLLAKLIVTGPDRATALARSRRALDELSIEGLATVIPFHRAVVRDPAFVSPDGLTVHTRWIETDFVNDLPPYSAAADQLGESNSVVINVGRRTIRVELPGLSTLGARADPIRRAAQSKAARTAGVGSNEPGVVTAPMQGTIVRLAVHEGQSVEVGDLIAVVEAMKMENSILATEGGLVADLQVAVGDTPSQDALLCRIIPPTSSETSEPPAVYGGVHAEQP
jgi:acetyl-CoA/propionyl-CoA carboxylase biotin carboxyl carrier protein